MATNELFQYLIDNYSLPEVKTLAFNLGFDHEFIPGQEKREYVREFIRHLERNGKLDDLDDQLKKHQSLTQHVETPKRIRQKVQIENPENISFPIWALPILEKMFAGYQKVTIKGKLSGFSGAHVLVMRPVGVNGADLQAVVKMADARLIYQEWHRFQKYIRRQIPQLAQIEGEPVFNSDRSFGGLRYSFVGGGILAVRSLAAFYEAVSLGRFNTLLREQLFKNLALLWADRQLVHDFPLDRSYDFWLPPQLLIDCEKWSANTPLEIRPENVKNQRCQPDDLVTLSGFWVTQVDEKQGEIRLNITPDEGAAVDAYQVAVLSVQQPTAFQAGQLMPRVITGVVIETRQTRLQAQAEKVLQGRVDVQNKTIPMSQTVTLPNPILMLPALLRQTADLYRGPIHGDVNLQNVLVTTDGYNNMLHLIDFARARRDHILHDLLCLEAGFLVHIFSKLVTNSEALPEEVSLFIGLLDQAISGGQGQTVPRKWQKIFHVLLAVRQEAHRYFAPTASWEMYFHCLAIYLVGMLDFSNLDDEPHAPLPKLTAFWAAANLCALPQLGPPLAEMVPDPALAGTRQPNEAQPSKTESPSLQIGNLITGGNIRESIIGGQENTINTCGHKDTGETDDR